jgi:CRP-like cAMP-binding protein
MNSPTDCQDCPVWKKSLFRDFEPALIDWVTQRKKVITLNKKDILFKQGEEMDGIYCHLSGLAKVVQKDTAGNVRFSRLVLPGDTSGHRSLFIETEYKATAEVMSDRLEACYIPKSDILYLLAHNASFAKNLVIKISSELLRSEEEQISAKERTVRERLAQLLYELCETHSQPLNENQALIDADITKVEIAGFLSVANETIIRLMSEMKTEELIAFQGKKIIVNDLARLKQIAKV